MKTRESIIAGLSSTARQSFGPDADIARWLERKNNSIGMTPLEYIESQREDAEEVLRIYLSYAACYPDKTP